MTAMHERLQDVIAEMRAVCPHEERFGDQLHEWADRLVAATALPRCVSFGARSDAASPAQPSGFEFVGWASQLQIDRLRSEQDLTGIMVHDEESAARTVRMYAAAPAPIEQEG